MSAVPSIMGSCPYCRSVTYTGDTICYTCGRVLANIKSKQFAAEQQFNQGSLETTYMKTKKPSRAGLVQTHTGRRKDLLKRRKNKFRSVVMLGLVAFIMLSPQARELVFNKWAGVSEYIQLAAAPYHLYPIETTYTVAKDLTFVNNGSAATAQEDLPIPRDITTLNGQTTMFDYTDGSVPYLSQSIQVINSIEITISGSSYDIPLLGEPTRMPDDKIITADGHEIWWPGVGIDDDMCSLDVCVKIDLDIDPNEVVSVIYSVSITSTSYSWWSSPRVDSRISGSDMGINLASSGTFEDIINRGGGIKSAQFASDELWYYRSSGVAVGQEYAINAQDEIVISTAESIAASLPEGLSNNAYAFARATFDYMHLNVMYDKNAPITARSGPACLAGGLGDCDEQTNAFFSILRTKMIPGWYALGALTDHTYEQWEGHAWGYIMLPMSDEWCNTRNIVLDDCFVEGSVDVVNNKWLLHTPTAYIEWIEQADPSYNLLNSYFRPGSYDNWLERTRTYTTIDMPESSGGKYQVKKLPENLR